MNPTSGRAAFLEILKDEGISILFGNPGTTELPIMDALAGQDDIQYVLGLQEAIVMAMADGYSRASGKLSACNVHVAPGLGNALGSLYNAKFYGSPVIITAGQQEQGHSLTEPLLYDSLVAMAAPLVKWAIEITRVEDLPVIMRRAAKVAQTPPTGPVFLSLPGDVLNSSAEMDLGASTRVDASSQPPRDVLHRLAGRLLDAAHPVLVVGPEVCTHNAFAEVAAVAEILGAPVYQQPFAYTAQFPSSHPLYMGVLDRTAPELRRSLESADLLLGIGADIFRMSVQPPVDPRPDGLPVIQIGLRDWELGKNYHAEMALNTDVKVTMAALAGPLREQQTKSQAEAAVKRAKSVTAANWSSQRESEVASIRDAATATPIDPAYLMLAIAEALPRDGVIVDEGLTSSRSLLRVLSMEDPQRYFGLASGGIGWGLPGAIGVQLALPDRPMIALSGDGSAMYSIQALWTAAHMKLPITFVIANNGGYRILKQRLFAFGGDAVAREKFIGMEFNDPEINFTALAESLGVPSRSITDPSELPSALQEGLARGGPSLLNVHVYGGYKS